MKKTNEEGGVYKEQITKLLLWLLQIADRDVRGSKDFEDAYRKRLKFQKKTDWMRFRASVDLIDDTEYALINAFEYQLGDLKKAQKDYGEMYLRLYGILNAVYLQMNAYVEIAKLLNYPEKNKIKKEFEQLDIYKLRGIAGSHTTSYLYDKKTLETTPNINKTTSFRIVQFYLERTGGNIVALDENIITLKFNLLKCLFEYEKLATCTLVDLIQFSIKTLVHKKEDIKEFKDSLNELLPNLRDYSKINKNL